MDSDNRIVLNYGVSRAFPRVEILRTDASFDFASVYLIDYPIHAIQHR